jgi:hypothetical protein
LDGQTTSRIFGEVTFFYFAPFSFFGDFSLKFQNVLGISLKEGKFLFFHISHTLLDIETEFTHWQKLSSQEKSQKTVFKANIFGKS